MALEKLWRLLKLWRGWTALDIASNLEYRFDFVLRTIAMVIFGMLGPLVATLIYSVSAGVPGWSYEQFLLITGTFTLVGGLDFLFFRSMGWKIVDQIRHGTYDKTLVKPVGALGFATATAFDFEGLPGTLVGMVIVGWSLIKMGWLFSLTNLTLYLIVVGLALLFKYALNVIVTSLSFLIVKSYTVLNIVDDILDIGRNPLTIYGQTGMLLFTFFLPVGLMAFYPASALLGKLSLVVIGELALVAFAFFGFSLLIWHFAIRKYASAGG